LNGGSRKHKKASQTVPSSSRLSFWRFASRCHLANVELHTVFGQCSKQDLANVFGAVGMQVLRSGYLDCLHKARGRWRHEDGVKSLSGFAHDGEPPVAGSPDMKMPAQALVWAALANAAESWTRRHQRVHRSDLKGK
jgi:hypothetical protein